MSADRRDKSCMQLTCSVWRRSSWVDVHQNMYCTHTQHHTLPCSLQHYIALYSFNISQTTHRSRTLPGNRIRERPKTAWMDNVTSWTGWRKFSLPSKQGWERQAKK